MDCNRSHIAGVLNLTVEIIYMLTGEDYTVVKKTSGRNDRCSDNSEMIRTQSPVIEPPPLSVSVIHERNNDKKVLELTNKIIHLLTGEVCQYLEGQKTLYEYVMMDNPSLDLSESRNEKEPVPCEDENATDIDIYSPINHSPSPASLIKEESVSREDGDVRGTDIYTPTNHKQCTSTPIKMEPGSCEEGSLTNLYIPTDETHYMSAHIKEEFNACEQGSLIDSDLNTPTDHREMYYTVTHRQGNNTENCNAQNIDDDGLGRTSDLEEQQTGNKIACKSLLINQRPATGKEQYSLSDHGSFSDQSDLAKWQKCHPAKTVFTCPRCQGHFSSRLGLFRHQIIHINQDRKLENAVNHMVAASATEQGKGKHPIQSMDVSENTTEEAYNGCQHQNYFISNSDEVDHQDTNKTICVDCGEVFAFNSQPLSQQPVCTEGMPYTCSQCGKCFYSDSHLIIHQRIHTGEKPFTCLVCGKCFATKSTLVIHQRIHTREKPYSCTVCQRCFPCNSQLVIHQRTHTGEKPYSCFVCGKGFISNSDLLRHGRIHTGERPFKCSECGKCFSQKSHLREHQKTHRK